MVYSYLRLITCFLWVNILENSYVEGYSFDCIKSMAKFLCILEIVPYCTMLKLKIGWGGVDRNCYNLYTYMIHSH